MFKAGKKMFFRKLDEVHAYHRRSAKNQRKRILSTSDKQNILKARERQETKQKRREEQNLKANTRKQS